jgi:hypothetical protein
MTEQNAKPCPFCGTEIDINDPDTLYRNGIGWTVTRGHTHYVSANQAPPEQQCYMICCNTIYGGCGAEINADSKEEAINKWNTRRPKI